jgi:hypothetical protein
LWSDSNCCVPRDLACDDGIDGVFLKRHWSSDLHGATRAISGRTQRARSPTHRPMGHGSVQSKQRRERVQLLNERRRWARTQLRVLIGELNSTTRTSESARQLNYLPMGRRRSRTRNCSVAYYKVMNFAEINVQRCRGDFGMSAPERIVHVAQARDSASIGRASPLVAFDSITVGWV